MVDKLLKWFIVFCSVILILGFLAITFTVKAEDTIDAMGREHIEVLHQLQAARDVLENNRIVYEEAKLEFDKSQEIVDGLRRQEKILARKMLGSAEGEDLTLGGGLND